MVLFLVFSFLLFGWSFGSAPTCSSYCNITLPKGKGSLGCFLDANFSNAKTFSNRLCPQNPNSPTPISFMLCLEFGQNFTMINPGPCGCPNDCQGRGTCDNGSCKCSPPYSGPGCDMCPTCNCGPDQSLQDCSGKTRQKQEPKHLIEGVRFTSNDDYGWEHPLFNQSTITQGLCSLFALFSMFQLFSSSHYTRSGRSFAFVGSQKLTD